MLNLQWKKQTRSEQKAMIIAKQKELLKSEELFKELSHSENGILYLLKAIRVFMSRPMSSDEYLSLGDNAKSEFAKYDKAGLAKYTKRRKFSLKSTELQLVVQANFYKIYSLYTHGYTWENITEIVNNTFGLDVSTVGLYRAFQKVSGSLSMPLPKRGKRITQLNKNTKNKYSRQFITSFLESKEEYIAEKRKKGVPYRTLAVNLSKMMKLRIGHSAVYMFCIKKGI
jgi:hypothetical protein